MRDRSKAAGRQGRRPGLRVSALAVLVVAWMAAPGDVRADSIVLKSGEVIDGSIVDATRNTVVVRRSIGGMRQMRIQDIEEVRLDLAQGQGIAGQLLSWADGVYQVRSGGQVVRVSEGNVLSREPREEAVGQPPREPSRPAGEQAVRMAAAPSGPGAEETVAQQRRGEDRSAAAGDAEGQAAGDGETQAAADARSQAVGEARSLAAARGAEPQAGSDAESQAAREAQSQAAGDDETQAAGAPESQAAGETRSLAAARDTETQAAGAPESRAATDAKRVAAVGDQPVAGQHESLAVRASVDPPEPGAESIVFKIELSRPAQQTVVLIYGTVDGTAKAGKDYEPQQGMMTLPPGTRSAEVRVPLLDGEPAAGEKRFELFLTADSRVAEIVDKQVIATIKGAD